MGGSTRVADRTRRALEQAGERFVAAREVGALGSLELALRKLLGVRRQFGLTTDLSAERTSPTLRLAVEDATAFSAFRDLAGHLTGRERLEVLWYARLAERGAGSLVVHRDAAGRPLFTTWVFDRREQAALHDRFLQGFHTLEDREVMIEGVFTFPEARGRGLATRALAAVLREAAARGADRAWAYPYADNPAGLRLFARVGFDPRHVRSERIVLGRESGRLEPLTANDLGLWRAITGAGQCEHVAG